MKLLIASDSFKGTLSSEFIGQKFCEAFPGSRYIVVSDGGEGFTDAILFNNKDFSAKTYQTTDDKNKNIQIKVALNKTNAIFDVASIIALHNYPEESAINKTTFGIGEIIKQLEQDPSISKISIGLGGTSTSDGGFGASLALGFKYLDSNDQEITLFENIKNAVRVVKPIITKEYVGFSDVTNPLLGTKGAVNTFGTQKFMSDSEKEIQEDRMKHYTSLFNSSKVASEGAGAAGGIGFFILEHLNGKLVSGVEEVIKLSNLSEVSKDYDYLITGEGRFDDQSFMGKVPVEIANASKTKNILVAGFITADIEKVKKLFTHHFELRQNNEDISITIKNSVDRFIQAIDKVKEVLENEKN